MRHAKKIPGLLINNELCGMGQSSSHPLESYGNTCLPAGGARRAKLMLGGIMSAKKILLIASLVLVPFLVKILIRKKGKEPEIAI